MELSQFSMAQEARNTEKHASWGDKSIKLRDRKINFIDAGFLPPIVKLNEDQVQAPRPVEGTITSKNGNTLGGGFQGLEVSRRMSSGVQRSEPIQPSPRPKPDRNDAGAAVKESSSSSSMEDEEVVFVPKNLRKPLRANTVVKDSDTLSPPGPKSSENILESIYNNDIREHRHGDGFNSYKMDGDQQTDNWSGGVNGASNSAPKQSSIKAGSAGVAKGSNKENNKNDWEGPWTTAKGGGESGVDYKKELYQKNLSRWLGAGAFNIPSEERSGDWSPVDVSVGEKSGTPQPNDESDYDSNSENVFFGSNAASSFATRDLGADQGPADYPNQGNGFPTISKQTAASRKESWGEPNEPTKDIDNKDLELLTMTFSKFAPIPPGASDNDAMSEDSTGGQDFSDSNLETEKSGIVPESKLKCTSRRRNMQKGKEHVIEDDEFDEDDLLELVSGNIPEKMMSGGNFPSASKLADAYDGFDVTDFKCPSLTSKKGKGKEKGSAIAEGWVLDPDAAKKVVEAQELDRLRKKMKKSEREAHRKLGMLSKKPESQPDLCMKYPTGMTFMDIRHEFKQFLLSSHETLSLPPMAKHERKQVHILANKLSLVSKSVGDGSSRYTRLHKTPRASGLENNKAGIDAIFNGSRSRTYDPLGLKHQSNTRNRDGDVVGVGAAEIGLENKGRMMLEKMGWNAGTGLGAVRDGRVLPVTAIIKTSRIGLG